MDRKTWQTFSKQMSPLFSAYINGQSWYLHVPSSVVKKAVDPIIFHLFFFHLLSAGVMGIDRHTRLLIYCCSSGSPKYSSFRYHQSLAHNFHQPGPRFQSRISQGYNQHIGQTVASHQDCLWKEDSLLLYGHQLPTVCGLPVFSLPVVVVVVVLNPKFLLSFFFSTF